MSSYTSIEDQDCILKSLSCDTCTRPARKKAAAAPACAAYAYNGKPGVSHSLALECARYIGTSSGVHFVRVEDGVCELSHKRKEDPKEGWLSVAGVRAAQGLPKCVPAAEKQDVANLHRCCVKKNGISMSDACMRDVREFQACLDEQHTAPPAKA